MYHLHTSCTTSTVVSDTRCIQYRALQSGRVEKPFARTLVRTLFQAMNGRYLVGKQRSLTPSPKNPPENLRENEYVHVNLHYLCYLLHWMVPLPLPVASGCTETKWDIVSAVGALSVGLSSPPLFSASVAKGFCDPCEMQIQFIAWKMHLGQRSS